MNCLYTGDYPPDFDWGSGQMNNIYLNKIRFYVNNLYGKLRDEEIGYDILNTKHDTLLLHQCKYVKQTQMKRGHIWQYALGNFHEFENLGEGHITGLDIMSKSRKIAIELKSRYNTDNSSSLKANRDKLVKFKKNNDDYTIVYGVINGKNSTGKSDIIKHNGYDIHYHSGKNLFEFIMGSQWELYITEIVNIVQQAEKKCYKL